MSTSILINIEGHSYPINVEVTQLAAEIVNDFLHTHCIDPDYHSAVELEILRCQARISSDLLAQRTPRNSLQRQKDVMLAAAEERARAAEQHVAKLSASLQNVEMMLPVILQSTHRSDRGSKEEKEAPGLHTAADSSGRGLEAALRSLMHHYGYVTQGREEGSMTRQEWLRLDSEETLMSSTNETNSPTKIEESLGQGLLQKQNHRSKRGISRLRSSSSDEYDQLSHARSFSEDSVLLYSWKARYFELRKKLSGVVEERNFAQTESAVAQEEMQRIRASAVTEELILENERLREQTVKLRGEILKLRENIVEVKSSAAQALKTMGALGKEMATSGLFFEGESGLTPAQTTPSAAISSPTLLTPLATNVKPSSSASKLPVRSLSPPKSLTKPQTSPTIRSTFMPTEEQYVHIDMLHSDSTEADDSKPAASTSSTHPSHHYNAAAGAHSDCPAVVTSPAYRHPADLTEQELPPVEDVLELALRSAQVPIVGDRLLRLIFDRYNSQDGRFLMNSFRYLRCLKDCGITINEEETVSSGTRWLSYGVVSIVFNDCLKFRPEEHAPIVSAINSHVRNTSTVLTLKGASDPRATSLTHAQFVHAMKMLSLRLYADIIESEFGAAIEFLREPVKSTASHQALELLLQDKLVPFAVKQDFMPWPLVHLERTLFALQHIPVAFHCLIPHGDSLIQWFMHYASGAQTQASTGAGASPIKSRPVGNQRRRIDDVSQLGMSYKALSRFAHDFGVVPYLLKEPQLFGLFQELQTWARGDPAVSMQALPDQITLAFSDSLGRVPPGRFTSLPAAKAGLERVSVATFAVALCILAMQDLDDQRVSRLLEWLQQGGGPSIIARSTTSH